MLRASCSILIKKLYEAGKIDEQRKKQCLDFIMKAENHQQIRNLIAMILLPKKLHKNDESQAAFLRAAVSRVSFGYSRQRLITVEIQEEKINLISDCESDRFGKVGCFDAGTGL